MVKAIFWDMDGTMVDTEPQWGIATYELSEVMGRRLTTELRELTVGGSLSRTIRICAEHAGIEVGAGDIERYRSLMLGRVAELFDEALVPNPGVIPLLAELAGRGVPMLVTTNTERSLAQGCIESVGAGFFIDSITGDEVSNPKPAPDMYLEAARRVGLPPSECLVFEDSFNGMTAAVEAGCRVIGLHPESVTPPDGVVALRELHGSNTFEGATADILGAWYSQLEPVAVRN